MNPVTPSSIALTAATRRTVHGRLPLPVWTAWTALAAAGVLAGAALLPRAAHAQVGANAPARIGVVGTQRSIPATHCWVPARQMPTPDVPEGPV